MDNRLRRAICALVLGFVSAWAGAWGPEGHAIVADIAQSHLTPASEAKVEALLKLEGETHLDEISSWADGNRQEFPRSGGWHYVDIPLAARQYDAARDCAGGNCVVVKLDEYTKVLADASARPADRLLALKWVVHLVGDIHQPLHAEDDDDKGGNAVQLQWFGKGTNLHSIWDGRIIERQLNLRLGPNYSFDHVAVAADARQLDAGVSQAQRDAWAPPGLLPQLSGNAVAWAEESHQLARNVAYADLPHRAKRGWEPAYLEKTWPVVQTRLQQGGVRLAEILNEALDPH